MTIRSASRVVTAFLHPVVLHLLLPVLRRITDERHTPRRAAFFNLTVAAAAFVYVLPEATELIDDHFMHVVWGRQLLYGRQPLLDMEALGMPLQAGLSALAERLFGYRLFSEGLLFSTAFASAAALTFSIAQQAARSVWIGLAAAALQVAVFPRTYSYPKLLVYSAAIVLLWRYVDAPSKARAATLGLATATAFLLRHDHGVYVGVAVAATLVLRHSAHWRVTLLHGAWSAVACALALTPFAAYIERHSGLTNYAESLRAVAAREYQQNRFDSWPRWPLSTLRQIVHWQRRPIETATIGVRWHEASTDEERRSAAARYRFSTSRDDRPFESGRFLLTDTSARNILSLLRDPVIEDTANIDRAAGRLLVQGVWIGRLHLLNGLDTPSDAAAFLLFAFAALLLATLISLLRQTRRQRAMPFERTKIAVVTLIGCATCIGFIREPLAVRVPDAIVAPAILVAWWTGRTLAGLGAMNRARRYAASIVLIAVTLVVVRSVVVIGAVRTRMERLTDVAHIAQQLSLTPPIDAYSRTHRAAVVRYVRSCTTTHDPLLVLWFAPDLYYYSGRSFGGRLGFYMEGYWTTPAAERMNVAAIERDRPTIALIESGREATDLYTYPHLMSYVADTYQTLGTLPSSDGRIRVLARKDRAPSSIDAQLGWPCYS